MLLIALKEFFYLEVTVLGLPMLNLDYLIERIDATSIPHSFSIYLVIQSLSSLALKRLTLLHMAIS